MQKVIDVLIKTRDEKGHVKHLGMKDIVPESIVILANEAEKKKSKAPEKKAEPKKEPEKKSEPKKDAKSTKKTKK